MRRSEKASKRMQMLKKQVFGFIETFKILPIDTQEESFAEDPFYAKELKRDVVGKEHYLPFISLIVS